MGLTISISLSISTEQQFFIKMIKSNELEIITRDAGASGLHSHASAWERGKTIVSNWLFHKLQSIQFHLDRWQS